MSKGHRQRPASQAPACHSQRATMRAATTAIDSATETLDHRSQRSTTQTSTAIAECCGDRFVTKEALLERLLQQIREEVRAKIVATPQLPALVLFAPHAPLHPLLSKQQDMPI